MSELAHRPETQPARSQDTQPRDEEKGSRFDWLMTTATIIAMISMALLVISPVGWLLGFNPLWLSGCAGGGALVTLLIITVWAAIEELMEGRYALWRGMIWEDDNEQD